MNTYTSADLNPPSNTLFEFDITNISQNYTVEVYNPASCRERLAAYYEHLQGFTEEKRDVPNARTLAAALQKRKNSNDKQGHHP